MGRGLRYGRSAAALGGAPLANPSLRLRARAVTAGGATGTSDGDARFAGVVSTAGN